MKKVFILIILTAGVFFSVKAIKKHKANKKINDAPTVEVTYGNIEDKVSVTGTIAPFNRVEIKPTVNGTIDELKVDEGDKVYKNEILGFVSSQDRISIIQAAETELKKAQKLGDSSKIIEAEKSCKMVQDFYKPVTLISPIAGEVILREVEPGQIITTSTGLLVLSDTLVATVEVGEADIGKINVGYPATIILDAFPDQEITGKITKISHESEVVSNVTIYDVMIRPDSVSKEWRSRMTVNVDFVIHTKENVLTLPISVIREKQLKESGLLKLKNKENPENNKYVIVLENGKQIPREVKTGIDDGTNIEIVNGLKEGDKVIYKIDSNQSQSQTKQSIPPPPPM